MPSFNRNRHLFRLLWPLTFQKIEDRKYFFGSFSFSSIKQDPRLLFWLVCVVAFAHDTIRNSCQIVIMYQTFRQQDATQVVSDKSEKNGESDSDNITLFQAFVAPKAIDLMHCPSKYAGTFPAISWDDDDADSTLNASSFSWMGPSPNKRRKTTSTGMVRSKALHSNLASLTHHQFSSVRFTHVMM